MAQLERLVIKLQAENKDLKRGLKQSEKQMDGFGKSVKKIGGLIAGAFAVGAITEFGKEAFKLAQKAGNIEKAFGKLDRSNLLLKDLTKATGGAVSQMELMQNAVQAVNLGIDQNQLASFFEFATIRAAETGESVDYLVNSIVTGVGRGSIQILDNLGISAQELGAGFAQAGNKAEIVGKIIKEQVKNSAVSVEDAATATDKYAAAMTNLQVAVGKLLVQMSPLINKATEFIDSVTNLFRTTEQIRKQVFLENMEQGAADAITQFMEFRTRLEDVTGETLTLEQASQRFLFGPNGLSRSIELAIKRGDYGLAETYKNERDAIIAYVKKQGLANALKEEELKNTKELTEAQKALAKAQASVGPARSLAGVGTSADIASKALLGDLEGSSKSVHAILLDTNFELEKMGENMKKIGQSSLTTQQQLELFRQKTGMVAITAQEMNMALEQMAEGMAIALGEALGDAISGVGNFGATLLSAFGGFMQKLGAMMIATAIKVSLFQKSLFSNPAVAVAAGIAMVAIGKAFSNKAAAMTQNIGGGGGGGGLGGAASSRGSGAFGVGGFGTEGGMQINIVGKIQGQDLIFMQEKAQRNRSIRG